MAGPFDNRFEIPSLHVQLASHIIQTSSREKPADSVLRVEMKTRKVTRSDSRDISHLVFTYFRWLGWLDQEQPLRLQLRAAQQWNQKFIDNPEIFTPEALAENSVPAWVKDAMPVPVEWLRAIQSEPRLWLRAKRGQGQILREKLGIFEDHTVDGAPEAIRYDGEADLFRSAEFHAGEFELQDLASQIVSLLCDPKPGETWWDACAGEGGKTLHLSDLMQNKGLIWASDRAEWRLKKLKTRTGRAQVFNYRAALWDGSAKLPTKTKFDGILVDAPCSGVGTWQRNPQARWTTSANDVKELSALQKQLLDNVAGSVKPGSKLIYSVCTLPQAETAEVAADFAAKHPEFEPLNLPGSIGAAASDVPSNLRWIWPQELGGNGMFIAGWRRK